ncbi:NAD(P)-binding domain-containing protein, partial [Streptomyces sp. NPDC003042]
MNTGIIGTGRIGSTLARILVAAGHEVVLANASGPRTLGPLLAELGSLERVLEQEYRVSCAALSAPDLVEG